MAIRAPPSPAKAIAVARPIPVFFRTPMAIVVELHFALPGRSFRQPCHREAKSRLQEMGLSHARRNLQSFGISSVRLAIVSCRRVFAASPCNSRTKATMSSFVPSTDGARPSELPLGQGRSIASSNGRLVSRAEWGWLQRASLADRSCNGRRPS